VGSHKFAVCSSLSCTVVRCGSSFSGSERTVLWLLALRVTDRPNMRTPQKKNNFCRPQEKQSILHWTSSHVMLALGTSSTRLLVATKRNPSDQMWTWGETYYKALTEKKIHSHPNCCLYMTICFGERICQSEIIYPKVSLNASFIGTTN
jgi:hypothetical protein